MRLTIVVSAILAIILMTGAACTLPSIMTEEERQAVLQLAEDRVMVLEEQDATQEQINQAKMELASLKTMLEEKTWTPEQAEKWKAETYGAFMDVVNKAAEAAPFPITEIAGTAGALLAALGVIKGGGAMVKKVKEAPPGKIFGS